MTMPETAIHEQDRMVFRKYEIWFSGNPGIVNPVPESTGVKGSTQKPFGLRISAPDPRH